MPPDMVVYVLRCNRTVFPLFNDGFAIGTYTFVSIVSLRVHVTGSFIIPKYNSNYNSNYILPCICKVNRYMSVTLNILKIHYFFSQNILSTNQKCMCNEILSHHLTKGNNLFASPYDDVLPEYLNKNNIYIRLVVFTQVMISNVPVEQRRHSNRRNIYVDDSYVLKLFMVCTE